MEFDRPIPAGGEQRVDKIFPPLQL